MDILILENSLDAPHFLYKHEDLISNHTCGYVGGHHDHNYNTTSDNLNNSEEHEFNRILRVCLKHIKIF